MPKVLRASRLSPVVNCSGRSRVMGEAAITVVVMEIAMAGGLLTSILNRRGCHNIALGILYCG
jgi:hypothetical protein